MSITRRSLPLLLAPCFLRGQTSVTEAEWSRFLAWFQMQSGAFRGGPAGVLTAYHSKLTADGMKPAEVEALIARLRPRVQSDTEFTRLNFNRIYSSINGPLRTTEPNAFLVETASGLRPGKALDLGMGEGRNTIFLAQKGWDVTGIDLSDLGVAKAKERARSLGLRLDARIEDVNRFDLGTARWDLICVLYFVIDERMPNLHQRIAAALKPGGLTVVEGVGLGGTLDALLQAWSKWEPTKLRLLRLEYREGTSDWGGSGNGRLLLQKPA